MVTHEKQFDALAMSQDRQRRVIFGGDPLDLPEKDLSHFLGDEEVSSERIDEEMRSVLRHLCEEPI
ncbi:MAG: hypothetical protein ACHP7F_06195, partial [Actinomycetales bacterium]